MGGGPGRTSLPKGRLQLGQASLTFWGCELNVILLAEGGWEDGMGGGMVTEPVRAICGGPPIHTDHQVAVQENLGGEGRGQGRQRTWYHEPHPHPRARWLWWGHKAMGPTGARSQLPRAGPELPTLP